MADYHTIRRCVTKILGMKPRSILMWLYILYIQWISFVHVQTSFLYILFKMKMNMNYSSELFQKNLQTH